MIRTEILAEIREWLEEAGWDLTVDDIKAEYEYQGQGLTDDEIIEVEDMIEGHAFGEELDEAAREAAEEEEAFRQYMSEIRWIAAARRAMVA